MDNNIGKLKTMRIFNNFFLHISTHMSSQRLYFYNVQKYSLRLATYELKCGGKQSLQRVVGVRSSVLVPPSPCPPRSSLVDRLADGGFLVVAGNVMPFDAVGVKIVQNSQAALKRYNFSIYLFIISVQYLTVQGEKPLTSSIPSSPLALLSG